MKKPLILVTNDDGVQAPGLNILSNALRELGRVIIVAPERDNSAASHSLTMRRPLLVRELTSDIFAIDGTPTDCVTIAIGKILGSMPDLVVSGINPGPNLGDDINYSGTVSAAKEGTMLGVPSFAVSLAGEGDCHFETAAEFAVCLAENILRGKLPEDTLFNVNIPNIPRKNIAGTLFTRQGRRVYEGAIKETYDPWGKKHFWIGGGTPCWDERNDTDVLAVLAGYISITPIHLDLTNYEALELLQKNWRLEFP